MLLQFSVENYLSIKDRITLSMLATNDKSLDQNLIRGVDNNNNFLKTLVIYGANAAGKSNIINALFFMKNFIIDCAEIQIGDTIPVNRFKLDDRTANSPSSFEIAFIKDGLRYLYGFKADLKAIHEEYLYSYPKGRRSVVFQRTSVNKYKFTKNVEEQKILSGRTLDNKLYLTASAGWNYQETTKVLEWFKTDLIVGDSITHSIQWKNHTGKLLLSDQEMRNKIERFIKYADVGVTSLMAEFIALPDDQLPKDMPDVLRKLILDDSSRLLDVKMGHNATTADNKQETVFFDLGMESMGTIKLFSLAGRWLEALKHGKTLVIDELDSSLHPTILDRLVNQFNSMTNKSNAQLIFSTHNMYILTLDNFRRDQIWFAEKNPDSGATDFYSLEEIKGVRKDENIAKGYINGRYGAVPFLSGWVE